MKNKKIQVRLSVQEIVTKTLFMTMLLLVSFISMNAQCDLACNDLVNISLDNSCMATITPDQMLEGETCPDEALTVEIENQFGHNIGDKVGAMHIGQTLKVTVKAEKGNSCWGNILVEDKFGPQLVCDTVYTTCSGSLTPGDSVSRMVSYAADITDPSIPSDASYLESFDIEVIGLKNSTILGVDFLIDIEHGNLNDLEVVLTNPAGTMVTLIANNTLSSTCNNGLMVTLDDGADMTYADLSMDCEDGVEKVGRFQANAPLDGLSSEDVLGTWTVQVRDSDDTEGGSIKKLVLVLEQEGALVSFPGTGDITGTEIGQNTFELEGLDPCGSAIARYSDKVIEQPCSNPIDRIIERTWNAVDAQGNQSVSCVQIIYVYRNDLSTLVLPPHYDGIHEDPLSCVDFGDMVPDSSVTGYPSGDFCDKVQIFPIHDKIIDICSGSYKVLRKFTILEWCTEEIIEYTQIIKVVDTIGPTLQGIEDITISALPFDCMGEYKAPKPIAEDACSDEFEYELSYKYADATGQFDWDGPFSKVYTEVINGEHYLTNLPIGTTLVKWTVTDQCNQSTDSLFTITVEDQVPPVAVCDEFTVVSIGADGHAKVPAFTFDDLSHDNCEIERFTARKMVDKCGIDSTVFQDTLHFCCEEIGDTILISMRVEDTSGNSNTCMVQIRVEDKLPPYIKRCPSDITLDCFEDYTDLGITGNMLEGVDAFDNCELDSIRYYDDEDIDKCGEGDVKRTWTIWDKNGFKTSCTQHITLRDSDPFDRDDIHFPLDYADTVCAGDLSVENLDTPYILTVKEDNCNLVAISWEDQPFYIVEDACLKILREWTVIDWCTYDNKYDDRPGIFTHLQVLKISNQNAPIVHNCVDLEIPAYNSDCTGDVDFTLEYEDDCTPVDEIQVYHEIDLNNDGSFMPREKGNTISATWPTGQHLVKWIVEDKCGNITTCHQVYTVVDRKNPTPYCITSLTTAVMNTDGTVEIWARDFDFGAFDNCTAQEDLLFTFNGEHPVISKIGSPHYFKGQGEEATHDEYLAGEAQQWLPRDNSSGRLFDCNYITNGEEGTIQLDISVWDEENNTDFCSIDLVLQDNEADACDVISEGVIVTGKVTTVTSTALDEVDVLLSSSISEMNTTVKSKNGGGYSFSDLLINADYHIDGKYEGNARNGVSTLDIVKIQRHLLGIDTFDDPLKVIAADADNNEKVTATDLLLLRKLVLGVKEEFGNGQKSWRFIDSKYEFANANDPFPYEDGIVLNKLSKNLENQNLLAIKIGDVDGDAQVNAREGEIRTRTEENFILQLPEVEADHRGEIIVPVYVQQKSDLLGMQFTLDYDPSMLRYLDILPGTLSVGQDNVGTMYEKDGLVTFSWNEAEAIHVEENYPLFELRFEVLEIHKFALGLTSAVTASEAYDGNGNRMELLLEQKEAENVLLLQNTPNPFSDITRIDFRLPKAMPVTLDINDASGALLKRISGQYAEGYNTIELQAEEIPTSGVLYYTLKAGNQVVSKKMIKL